jgi:hypothetical protein
MMQMERVCTYLKTRFGQPPCCVFLASPQFSEYDARKRDYEKQHFYKALLWFFAQSIPKADFSSNPPKPKKSKKITTQETQQVEKKNHQNAPTGSLSEQVFAILSERLLVFLRGLYPSMESSSFGYEINRK